MFANQITATTTPALVVSTTDGAATGNSVGLTVKNLGAVTAWLAETAAKATSSAGFPLDPGQSVSVQVPGTGSAALYAATASGTSQVAVLEG